MRIKDEQKLNKSLTGGLFEKLTNEELEKLRSLATSNPKGTEQPRETGKRRETSETKRPEKMEVDDLIKADIDLRREHYFITKTLDTELSSKERKNLENKLENINKKINLEITPQLDKESGGLYSKVMKISIREIRKLPIEKRIEKIDRITNLLAEIEKNLGTVKNLNLQDYIRQRIAQRRRGLEKITGKEIPEKEEKEGWIIEQKILELEKLKREQEEDKKNLESLFKQIEELKEKIRKEEEKTEEEVYTEKEAYQEYAELRKEYTDQERQRDLHTELTNIEIERLLRSYGITREEILKGKHPKESKEWDSLYCFAGNIVAIRILEIIDGPKRDREKKEVLEKAKRFKKEFEKAMNIKELFTLETILSFEI